MILSQQRLVIDANVIISSVLSVQGKARQAFDLAIVTGDEDLLVLDPFRQIPIVCIQTFLAWME